MAQMEDQLSPEEIRDWIALAIHDNWGEEWRAICTASGAKFKEDHSTAEVAAAKWQK